MLRWIIKILLFPISLLLSILIAFMTFLLSVGMVLLYFLMILCVVGAIASFIQNKTLLGIEALFLGFLFSPYGIPMLGASIIAFLHVVNKGIKSILIISSMVAKDDGSNCRLFSLQILGRREGEKWTLTISITGKQRDSIF